MIIQNMMRQLALPIFLNSKLENLKQSIQCLCPPDDKTEVNREFKSLTTTHLASAYSEEQG